MSLVTRSAEASIDVVTAQFAPQITGLYAGEDLDVVAPCYIKSSDGKVYMSNGTSANEAAEVVGFTSRAAVAGQPVTLFGHGTRFGYGTGLTPGDIYFVGGTKGRLDTAPTTGDAFGVAQAITSTDIRITCDTKPLTSATIGAGTVGSTELADLGVTEAKVAVGAADAGLTGLVVKFGADDNVIGTIPVLHRIPVAAGAVGAKNVTLTHKTRIIDAWVVLTGAGVASCTLTIGNGANAITNAMDVSGADKAIVRAASIDDARHEIAAGGSLRVTTAAGATQPDCIVYVLGERVA